MTKTNNPHLYCVELITKDKELYWSDSLNQRDAIETIRLYLSFGGRVRVWKGMTFICQYSI